MNGRDFRRGNSKSEGTEASECSTLGKQLLGSALVAQTAQEGRMGVDGGGNPMPEHQASSCG